MGSWRSGFAWYSSPHRERGGAASEASGGRGGEGVVGMHMAQNISGRNAPPFARYEQKGGSVADAERRGAIMIL